MVQSKIYDGREHLCVVVAECSQLRQAAQQTSKVLRLLWVLQDAQLPQHVQHGLLKPLDSLMILDTHRIFEKRNVQDTAEVVITLDSLVVEETCLWSVLSVPSVSSPVDCLGDALVFFRSLLDLHWISVSRPASEDEGFTIYNETEANLADGEAKDLLKIGRLADQEQVEGPAAAEVGHDDGIDRHGGEETTPRYLKHRSPIDIDGVVVHHLHNGHAKVATDAKGDAEAQAAEDGEDVAFGQAAAAAVQQRGGVWI
ncbi:hypothetical protein EYF80_032364 [Liparis tanakae]|uniref:Uncharacterized protein n=1 Tax=Liparis tanakae TaxID=230148 RepID=A0A4Z2GWC3_9TELE|nr:hypothetical protein EYF80_032364 [Liparis tanakae]